MNNSLRERVTSTYAEIYLDDDFCDIKRPFNELKEKNPKPTNEKQPKDDWVSPSDLLIGTLDLQPPFTSKITRGKTHEGILAIGNSVLEKERNRFLKYLTGLIHENDAAWNYILDSDKASVIKKVKEIYNNIFKTKSKIMTKEISMFYESTLQDLEHHIRAEVENLLVSVHANIISDLNTEIKHKLEKERDILEKVLQKKYESEVKKINQYYTLLLRNELYRNNKLVNQAIHERNDALKAFYRQVEAANTTSTMYVMSTERKKCRIKQFLLENYQSTEISDKLQKIKERQDVIEAFKDREVHISVMNKEWEEKIKKVLQIFLKFISFSLKLLPEQTTFLLDLEKMVVLQLNEIQKSPKNAPSILKDTDDIQNIFKFEPNKPRDDVCDKVPFVVVGDLSDPIPPRYGSRETLPSDVDLPSLRLQRQFVYAKCHKFEVIKEFLESQRCKCSDIPLKIPSKISVSSTSTELEQPSTSHESESSNEPLLIDDIQRLYECPVRRCKDWAKRTSFPCLNSYLDFTEENFERVKTILGTPPKRDTTPQLVDPKTIVYRELLFSATKEPWHNVETQYSSQEDFDKLDIKCTCVEDTVAVKYEEPHCTIKDSPSKALTEMLNKRKTSLRQILQQNPKLLKMFTDECFDFQL